MLGLHFQSGNVSADERPALLKEAEGILGGLRRIKNSLDSGPGE
jgi:hypothetical protein